MWLLLIGKYRASVSTIITAFGFKVMSMLLKQKTRANEVQLRKPVDPTWEDRLEQLRKASLDDQLLLEDQQKNLSKEKYLQACFQPTE